MLCCGLTKTLTQAISDEGKPPLFRLDTKPNISRILPVLSLSGRLFAGLCDRR